MVKTTHWKNIGGVIVNVGGGAQPYLKWQPIYLVIPLMQARKQSIILTEQILKSDHPLRDNNCKYKLVFINVFNKFSA